MKSYEATKDIHITLPLDMIIKIDEFCIRYRRDNKSSVIKDLLNIGLLCMDNWQKIGKPDVLKDLHNQFEEGTIVDNIMKMDRKQFDVLYSIFTTEHKARYGRQEGLF